MQRDIIVVISPTSSNIKVQPPCHIVQLPTELLVATLTLCSSTDVSSVCRICRLLYNVGVSSQQTMYDLN
jgi:hypothetical protein